MNLSIDGIKIRRKKSKRVGRGVGSGRGKTSGRGHKGAGQRKGKKTPYLGYRGGSLPFVRLIPKRGFTSPRKKECQIVSLDDIQKRVAGLQEVNPDILKELRLIKDEKKPVKILSGKSGGFASKLLFKADKFSVKAKELIEKNGGSAECLKR